MFVHQLDFGLRCAFIVNLFDSNDTSGMDVGMTYVRETSLEFLLQRFL